MDYLLRDSYHAGVQYGRFDHNRLINTLRILPRLDKQTDEPALGLEAGGIESSEALMIARHFIFSQVYYHHIRRIYDIHLVDFLKSWLPNGVFPASLSEYLSFSDAEVIMAIRHFAETPEDTNVRELARRIDRRKHFKRFYSSVPEDKIGGELQPGRTIFSLAVTKFGGDKIRYDYLPPKSLAPDFPVKEYDDSIHSSMVLSKILSKMPEIEIDSVYCDDSILRDAISWRQQMKASALHLNTQERLL